MSVIEVATPADLQKVGSGVDGWNLDSDYIQTADIDMAGETWTPIGVFSTVDIDGSLHVKEEDAFTGFYNGQGFRIKNLSCSTAGTAGMFGCLAYGGKLENIKLSDASMDAGGVAGSGAGGLVVWYVQPTAGSRIYRCSVDGSASHSVASQPRAGLLVAMTYYLQEIELPFLIEECTVRGSVIADGSWSAAGGIVGDNWGEAVIKNCYSRADISARYSGGLVGAMNYFTSIENSYAAGAVADRENSGGLVGAYDGDGIINSYYDEELSGHSDTGKGEPKTTAEMQNQQTYIDWDFAEIWTIGEDGYPTLSWSIEDTDFNWEDWDWDWDNWDWEWEDWDWSEELFDITFIVKNQQDELLPGAAIFLGHLGIQHTDGSGETLFEQAPIQYWLTYTVYLSGYEFYTGLITFQQFQQHQNYALTIEVEMEEKWIPIYDHIDLYNIRYHLTGKYRLMNHIRLTSYGNWLPIGNNTSLPDSAFTGQLDGNGYEIFGMNIVSGSNDYQALFGAISGAEIKQMGIRNSKSNGDNCALLIGYCYDSLVEECYAAGEVSGTGICGGLISNAVDSSLLNCYSRVEVEGDTAGGLAGQFNNTTGTHLYSSELVDGVTNSGGLVGLQSGSTFIYCYYDTEISLQNDTDKGIPTLTENMKKQLTYLNWDFIDIWDIDEIVLGS